MASLLAYAEAADTSGSSLLIIVISVAAIVVLCGLAFVPIGIAWSRRHRQSDAIAAIIVLWGLLAAGSVIYTSMSQLKWSKERMVRIQSGYYDPQDNSDAPAKPWVAWAGLGIVYFAMIGWAASQKRPPVRREEETPPPPGAGSN